MKNACMVKQEKNAMIGEPIIRVRDLSKRYISVDRGVVRAVDKISFDVKEGEIFGLVGVSGAGKTTTSKIFMGILPPTSGEVEVRVGDEWIDMTKSEWRIKEERLSIWDSCTRNTAFILTVP